MDSKFLHNWTRSQYYQRIFNENKAKISQLLEICSDRKSADSIKLILKAYSTIFRAPEYWLQKAASEECAVFHFTTQNGYKVYGTENPYFLLDIFSFSKDTVLLDGGAYIGDTIELLARVTSGAFRYVYAFEPNPHTYSKLVETCKKYPGMVDPIFAGLDDHDGVMPFVYEDSGSKIDKDGNEEIRVIDAGAFLNGLNELKPNFIKLDIEGRESEVLSSMKDYIQREKPDMAVSIYHKLEDLWNLPLLLHEIYPEYKLYIRHQSNYYTETICYATTR